MCIAIVKLKDAVITDEELSNCFNRNPDGAGLAYTKENILYYMKGIFDEQTFIKSVREAEKIADGAMLIHCRIGTSGLKDKNNCHPFVVNDTTVMIHNGILDIDVPKDSKISDTAIFVRDILQPLEDDFIKNEAILNLIEHAIGNGNKLCFLNRNGEYAIVNEKAGHWRDGVWFSNDSYKAKKQKSYYQYTMYDRNYLDDLRWYDKEYDNEYGTYISQGLYQRISNYIMSLTDEEMAELGAEPVYDYILEELKPEYEFDGQQEFKLWELDDNLQAMYEERYYLHNIDTLNAA